MVGLSVPSDVLDSAAFFFFYRTFIVFTVVTSQGYSQFNFVVEVLPHRTSRIV